MVPFLCLFVANSFERSALEQSAIREWAARWDAGQADEAPPADLTLEQWVAARVDRRLRAPHTRAVTSGQGAHFAGGKFRMHRQRLAALVAVFTLVMALIPGAGQTALAGPQLTPDPSQFQATPLTPDSTYVGTKSPTAQIAQTDPALLGRTDSTLINVMIKYDYDATASYGGGVAGLEATSPSVTGKKLKNNKAAVDAYEQHAKQVSTEVSSAITAAVPSAAIGEAFVTAYGGVAAQIPANRVADVLKVAGVAAVQSDSLEQPQSDATQFIGAVDVWPS